MSKKVLPYHHSLDAYIGPKGEVPQTLKDIVSQPQYFAAQQPSITYKMLSTPIQGDSMYIPLAFYARLPNWGSDLSNYTSSTYTGSGSMIIKASWL